jgi:UDP-galactopyranose mutase
MTDRTDVLVVGAGWSGAVVARDLHDAGLRVHVVEKAAVVGGHARCEVLNGVVYEPNGAHIFHTSNRRVAQYVQRFGMTRPYEHRVVAQVYLRDDDESAVLLSWPPQIAELRSLVDWPIIERELAELPALPKGEDFESWVVSLMGRHLYRLFIEEYTRKQWGCEPSALSSRFAPRRIELRDDGYTRLFRDQWEFFPAAGASGVIEAILDRVPVTCGVALTAEDLLQMQRRPRAVIVTAPLDDFLGRPGTLAWRGIRMVSRYVPTRNLAETVTPAYVVNHPSARVPYTRTVETKHASGQLIGGTVVSEEHPGASARHYPVPTVDRVNEAKNVALRAEVEETMAGTPVFYCGRLATYSYINQDQAIEGAFSCAAEVMRRLAEGGC